MDSLVDRVDQHEEAARSGERMYQLMSRLYPLCRSITGKGLRDTLDIIGEILLLDRSEVPSGTSVFDWTVPDEWNIADAYVATADGRRVVDFRQSNLHVVNYSVPVRTRLSLESLRPRLHSLPDHPDWVPYRTSYYNRDWGFCLADRVLRDLDDGEYDVFIDSTIGSGALSYGQFVIPGATQQEVLFSAHVCHPSLANDNLSGIAVAVELASVLSSLTDLRYTYRFLFAPGTIGSLTWLSQHGGVIPRVQHGLVLTGLGGPGQLVYKQSRQGGRGIDRATSHIARRAGGEVRRYSPYGYDERQYNAVGFDMPVGRLSRTPHGEYAEYHTSADDLTYVKPEELSSSLEAVLAIVDVLENDCRYVNLNPHGEPQLGKRGLYPSVGGRAATAEVMSMLWNLAYADGRHSLLEIADMADLDFASLRRAGLRLVSAGLLASPEDSTAQ